MTELIFDDDELQSLVEKLVAEHGGPAVSVALRQGENVSTGVAGLLNIDTGVEATPDSIFQIGSNTKVYNATMAMQLVDEGKLDLDAPIGTYLPDFRLADADAATLEQITMRRLLTHTSGIDAGDYFKDCGRGDDAIEKYVASFDEVGMLYPVGKYHSYNNGATVIAGRVIEVLRGMPWHRVLKTYLLDPLGLEHSTVLPEEAILHRAAAGHQPNPDDPEGEPRVVSRWMMTPSIAPAGSTLCTSASDLCAFGAFHIRKGTAPDGTRLLSEESILAMRDLQYPDIAPGRGIGWAVTTHGGHQLLTHGGGTSGQQSQFMVFPELETTLVVLMNGPAGQKVAAAVNKEIFTRLFGDDYLAQATALAPASEQPDGGDALALPIDLAKYAGSYARKDFALSLEVSDDGQYLVLFMERSGVPEEEAERRELARLRPKDAETFGASSAEGAALGEAKFLELGADGRPGYFQLGRIAKRVS
ncbi:MAG TPA: serine hydrolase domain-containing protein [Acidimicrobiales bacterium]|nr:serine hydrolase domain-containing protein [Acidimicrobiales bacterium]